jgi:hypothetical protein
MNDFGVSSLDTACIGDRVTDMQAAAAARIERRLLLSRELTFVVAGSLLAGERADSSTIAIEGSMVAGEEAPVSSVARNTPVAEEKNQWTRNSITESARDNF